MSAKFEGRGLAVSLVVTGFAVGALAAVLGCSLVGNEDTEALFQIETTVEHMRQVQAEQGYKLDQILSSHDEIRQALSDINRVVSGAGAMRGVHADSTAERRLNATIESLLGDLEAMGEQQELVSESAEIDAQDSPAEVSNTEQQ